MHQRHQNRAGVAFSLLAYASFAFSLVYLVGFLVNFHALPVTVDRGPAGAAWLAAAIDFLLIAAFGIQHSVMARRSFKKRWVRYVPASLERSVYVLVSSIVTLLLCLAWRPLPDIVWSVVAIPTNYLAWAAFGIGLAVLIAASFQIDHWELLGLRQAWNALRGTSGKDTEFTLRGFYRFVRHPIYVGWLLLFWITPEMSVGHLVLAAGMTVYTLVAIRFEERDLVHEHGPQYLEYRQRVPALVPRPMGNRRAAARSRSMCILPVIVCIGAALGTARSWAGEAAERFTVTIDGRERTAYIVAPAAVAEPHRLVLMLHGAGGNADRIRRFTAFGLEQQAEAGDWVVAYPEGIDGTWNDCRKATPYPARRLGVNDVGFLTALTNTLRARYGIAAADVFVAGFSNGGQMAIRLAVEQPGVIGGIVVVAAQLPAPEDSVCAARIPAIRSMWINGSEDPFIPPGGGPSVGPDGSDLGAVLPLAATIRAFAEAGTAVTATPARTLPEFDGDRSTRVVRSDWTAGGGVYLRQYVLHGSGHVVPQRETELPSIAGHGAGDIDFGEVVAGFVNAGSPGLRAGRGLARSAELSE